MPSFWIGFMLIMVFAVKYRLLPTTGAEAGKHNCDTLGVRPEHVEVQADGPWTGVVGLAEHLGSDTFLKVACPEIGEMTVRGNGEMGLHHDSTVRLQPRSDRIYRFDQNGLAMK